MKRGLALVLGVVLLGVTARAAADESPRARSSTTAIDAELAVDTATIADDPITADLVGPLDEDERLEIGLEEVQHDAQFDPIAAQELLDAIHAIDPLETTAPIWPPQRGASGEHTWDIPIAEDPRVDMWIAYFMGAGRERFQIWLSRLTRYAPLFWRVLEERGLPKDTIFLAMIESGFSTRATSWAAAAGPWQFMPATGRHYGLEVSFWVDERRDFELSTYAAAHYLKDLYTEFGDWMLAWAAYNTGENRIRRCLKRTGTADFWQLSRTSMLYRETKHYVPKLIAAALISKEPDKYGLEVAAYLPPLEWETITVTTAIDLKTLAELCAAGVVEEDLLTLNPAMYRGISPPGRAVQLRVPRGTGASCAMGLSLLPAEKRMTYRYHRVQKKDTVASVAKMYRTSVEAITTYNKLNATRLALYEALVIPVPADLDREVAVIADRAQWNHHPPFTPLSGSAPVRIHRVRSGDSLWRIARKYGVSLSNLKSWNRLSRSARIRIGQQLHIR